MARTYFMAIRGNDQDKVCEAIDELYLNYKNVNIITILTDGLNNYIFYRIGKESLTKEDN